MIHHAEGLRRLGVADEVVRRLMSDPTTADVPPRARAMLDYALKVNATPWMMGSSDVHRLRQAGFADCDIHDICTIAAYFAFVNRIADGLGVELEDGWDRALHQ